MTTRSWHAFNRLAKPASTLMSAFVISFFACSTRVGTRSRSIMSHLLLHSSYHCNCIRIVEAGVPYDNDHFPLSSLLELKHIPLLRVIDGVVSDGQSKFPILHTAAITFS